jgi:hypothetical protein
MGTIGFMVHELEPVFRKLMEMHWLKYESGIRIQAFSMRIRILITLCRHNEGEVFQIRFNYIDNRFYNTHRKIQTHLQMVGNRFIYVFLSAAIMLYPDSDLKDWVELVKIKMCSLILLKMWWLS